MVRTARTLGRERLALVMETICATGIRVGEVPFITVEAVCRGRTDVALKGKVRTIFFLTDCAVGCCNTPGNKKSPPARSFSPEAENGCPAHRSGRR